MPGVKIRFLDHSGFMIEGGAATVIIDYYNDKCDGERAADNGVVDADTLSRPGRLYVLASHRHADHFNPVVLNWRRTRPDITYILSDDILKKKLVKPQDCTAIKKGGVFSDGVLSIKAYGSTDTGVSFLLGLSGKTFFHAGDLNNWHWREESTEKEAEDAEKAYLKELCDIAKETGSVDAAMFPVDPRLGKDYMLGAEQFVQRIRCGTFAPMHFWGRYKDANAFKPIAEANGAKFFEISRRGQQYALEDGE